MGLGSRGKKSTGIRILDQYLNQKHLKTLQIIMKSMHVQEEGKCICMRRNCLINNKYYTIQMMVR
jgi:hypothetical protein